MTRTNKFRDSLNAIPTWVTAVATVALVIVTICYVNLLQKQTALHEDPILKLNPNQWSVSGEKPGVFGMKVSNTGASDVKNVKVYQDCFVPIADSPLVMCKVGSYSLMPVQTISQLTIGESVPLQIEFKDDLQQMASLLASKKGMQYRILRLTLKFNRTVDEKEFSFVRFYIITGHGDALIAEDERNAMGTDLIPIQRIKRILGG